MNKLKQCNNVYEITRKKTFTRIRKFKEKSIRLAFDFAYDMSFGGKGKHRDHRSGGNHNRKNGEIFINTFQGKLSEFGIYNEFYNKVSINMPDLNKYDLGMWDQYDFKINDKKIAVKSTKYYGNLLLLETKDWTIEGEYIPNLNTSYCKYDYFILTRISVSGEDLMKKNKFLYSQVVDKAKLEKVIFNETWSYDIPGYVTNSEIIEIMRNGFILPQGSILGGSTRMDAENYYVQAGDMHSISELLSILSYNK